MAAGINAVVLVGNLTKDVELRTTPQGQSVAEMRLAVNSREKAGDQWRDRADYFDIRVWGKLGELCAQYLARGSTTGISGVLRFEEWTPQGSDKKRSRVVVVARDVQFLSRRDGDSGGNASAGSGGFSTGGGDGGGFSTGADDFSGADDDIPF